MAATASCENHECDPNTTDYGCPSADVDPSARCCAQGEIVMTTAGLVWESTPVKAKWLPFNPSGTINVYTAGWTDALPDPNLSSIEIASGEGPADPFPDADSPDAPVSISASAGGSLGEYTIVTSQGVHIYNSTCSPEYVRVTLGFDIPDGGLTHGPCWKH